MLESAERRIAAERSRDVVSWSGKDHRELTRLLKKVALYIGDPHVGALISIVGLHVAAEIEPRRINKFEYLGLSLRLGQWCAMAQRYFDKERHPAIMWLVKQYEDKEDRKIFQRVFGGGTVDSIARRIYQKARDIGEFEHVNASIVDDWAEETKGDLYNFTFKMVGYWPEPGLTTIVYWLARHRQHLDERESAMFQETFGAINDDDAPYQLALKTTENSWLYDLGILVRVKGSCRKPCRKTPAIF